VPFFILAGNLMNSAGITNRIYDFAVALAGWTRGGLAHVNIIGSVIFAGMSGTADRGLRRASAPSRSRR
jgi:TRAP-type C4-dicarboxylate transport system permease large subunit